MSEQHPDSSNPQPAATRVSSEGLAERLAEERADIQEDRRRQRELDEGEMGGES